MFGTIKRVISDPEVVRNKEGKISKTDVHARTMEATLDDDAAHGAESATNLVNAAASSPITTEQNVQATSSLPPAVVECDDRVEADAVVSIVADPNSSVSTASSVSDHSADGDARKPDDVADSPVKTQPGGIIHHESPLSRPGSHVSTDSLASSIRTGATSSRDLSGNWGWFEDVHGADGSSIKDSDKGKRSSLRSKRVGLLQYYAMAEPLNDAFPRSMDSGEFHFHLLQQLSCHQMGRVTLSSF